jgi:acetyl-CoA carboxylase biotin carboxyl carrier protein
MNLKEVRALVQLMASSNLSVLEISEADLKIRLEKAAPDRAAYEITPPVYEHAHAEPRRDEPESSEGTVDFNRITEVKSPMVGVFYAAPAPDAEPYVRVGSKVKKGDVLCVIEAMKLMNEIVAETDGEVVDICVENGQVVEYAQILFKVF